ncbi:hypothetical protein CSB45_09820 [candidate division KSB3 bacterium]|uniref:Outer membrane lipoprotein BamD-like domain-containing protein n=1 Tax=candidate division KSB3 bacterium TaxID=2044937 RepID=A0A2G6E3R7_9BACT|nr:MAG: hypothetical protein CSB45_09820 [candidate division KSB3 bacterium]PIE29382.1 MAG: hypothetical protein CSA57_09275 [candidate division KSB3 bacterium]
MCTQKGLRYYLSGCIILLLLAAFADNSHAAADQGQVLLDLQEQIIAFRKEFKQRSAQAQEDRNAVYENIRQKFSNLNEAQNSLNDREPELSAQLEKIQPMLEQYGEQIETLEAMLATMESSMQRRLDEFEAQLLTQGSSASGRPERQSMSVGPRQTMDAGNEDGQVSEEDDAGGDSLNLSEGELFRLAYRFYTQNDYDVAIGGFQKYLNDFPQGQLAGPAQYWIAESFLKLEDFEIARQEFERLIANYPRDNKVPDAHYGIGVALQKLGHEAESQAKFQYVLDHFSGSIAAERVQRQLKNQRTTPTQTAP